MATRLPNKATTPPNKAPSLPNKAAHLRRDLGDVEHLQQQRVKLGCLLLHIAEGRDHRLRVPGCEQRDA